MPTSSVHERLVNSLKMLNDSEQLTYLIHKLNETKINNYAEAAIFIFTMVYCHPTILSETEFTQLQKLCQDCFIHATPNQLFNILSRPENTRIKDLFDQFIEYALDAPKKEKNTASRGNRR